MSRDLAYCPIHGEYMEFGPDYDCPDCQGIVRIGDVTVEDRLVPVHAKSAAVSCCLVARVSMTDRHGLSGFEGEMVINVGDIAVARRLQSLLEERLAEKCETPQK